MLGILGNYCTARLSETLEKCERKKFFDSQRKADVQCTEEKLRKSPNRIIFPFGIARLNGKNDEAFRAYRPEELVDDLIADDSVFQLDSIRVEFAVFFKERRNPKHELLLFKISDSDNPGVSNYVLLDRTIQKATTSVVPRRPFFSLQKEDTVHNLLSGEARDRFRISTNGSFKTIIDGWAKSHDALEVLTFPGPKSFDLLKLLALASITSRLCAAYHIRDGNCYWYAGTIWECMLSLAPEGFEHKRFQSGRGAFFATKWEGPDSREHILSRFSVESQKHRDRFLQRKLVCYTYTFNDAFLLKNLTHFIRKYMRHGEEPRPRKGKRSYVTGREFLKLLGFRLNGQVIGEIT